MNGAETMADAILRCLRHGPARPCEIASELGRSRKSIGAALTTMHVFGAVVRLGHGVYALPARPAVPATHADDLEVWPVPVGDGVW